MDVLLYATDLPPFHVLAGQGRVDILPDDAPRPATGPRVTTPYLTKYERARILGTRAVQISFSAPIFVDKGTLTGA